ncbi:MAG: hypothetical protein KC877_01640 [Candidatus Kaiserbacteria bacterium]|nr:hypothetical protein [Candidatus Kaiserbacteria bacterium]MCB9816239.1 hypothetical protein [Candidatus Nomurabacteria bacterium]
MYTDETTNLPSFETAKPDDLVYELFHLFERSGRWFDNVAQQCERLLWTEADREAWTKAQHAMSEEQRAAEQAAYMATLGSFAWISELDEFGLWMHTTLESRGVTIHAFRLGYGEPGRSDDPTMYVLHHPDDKDDYTKVYVIRRDVDPNSSLRRTIWVNEPIQKMYEWYLQSEDMDV